MGTELKLKLNVKKTITVGLAFLAISMFWTTYDNLMPLMLRELGFGETLRGLIMCADNILALVLLPFMGMWSDNLKGKIYNRYGRRIPFIVVGSILAALFFLLLNFCYNMAMNKTVDSCWLAIMLIVGAFLLVSMCLYRTPAVALMPDVTPKVIRSQGNAVINIMGTIGGVVPTVLMMFNVFLSKETTSDGTVHLVGNNWLLVGIISGLMILTTIIMIIKVKENKMVEEKRQLLERLGISEDDEVEEEHRISIVKGLGMLDRSQRKSLIFILISVALWYFAYNGVVSHFSTFAFDVLKMENFSIALIVGQAAAFIFFIPASKIGEKIGRKKAVMLGVSLLITGFGMGSVMLYLIEDVAVLKDIMFPVFAFVGAGWATINVHSFVMSVEMANKQTTGVFTGLYYSFSMGAQIFTPILAGMCMEFIDSRSLLLYATIFSILAFVSMCFVKHGNVKTDITKDDLNEQRPTNN